MVERTDNPIVTRIKSGQVPEAAKLNAARGLLPIPAEDLVGLLVYLTKDPSPEVSAAAATSLAEFPEAQLVPIVENESAPTEVLDHYGRTPRSEAVSQALLLNPGTPDEAIEQLAASISAHLLDILIRNELRLIRHPVILERIEANPATPPAVRKRCQEIRESFLRPVAAPAAAAAPAAPEPAVEAEQEPAAAAAGEPVAVVDGVPVILEEPPTAALAEVLQAEKEVEADPDASDEQKKLTLEQKIMRLTVVEKIKLAYAGGRQARLILIRETNRTVSGAVLQGGKLTLQEVELISQFRNIDDDVLRRFATSKVFTKSYTICHNLVKNPRTPIALALNLMARLQFQDLKKLENNNNVSGHIREQAKRISRQARSSR